MVNLRRLILVIGTAGAGKSCFSAAYSEWLRDNMQSVGIVNLDPAVMTLPYEPDIDVREMVDYERIMATKGLGPNAALISSLREVARERESLIAEVESLPVDYVIVDTPGQLELFVFRREGRIIARDLARCGRSIIAYMIDPVVAVTPRGFASMVFLATSVYLTLPYPMILLLSKMDAVPKKYLRRVSRWAESIDAFEVDVDSSLSNVQILITKEVARIVHEIAQSWPLHMISSRTLEGIGEMHASVTRALGEGEDELR
ncbi:MAG: ATP/GTP-binding protein [Nitrososphaerota archaeon]|nr:ATP/GTP-binding protein [Nitrososphaerota archaeon]